MFRGIYTAAGGMISQQVSINTVTNNMANSQTTGYKKDNAVMTPFQEHLMYHLDASQNLKVAPIGSMPYGVEVASTEVSYQQGNLESTGGSMDFAIDGEGFFVVQTPQGVRLTRDGAFKVDGENYLVTGQGYRVVGSQGAIAVNGQDFTIDEGGRVIENGVEIDRLNVVDFANRGRLQKEGDGLFSVPGNMNAVVPDFKIRQGYLERSNVDMNQEMSGLMVAFRTYEANSKVFQTYDQIGQLAVRDIGSLK